MYMLSQAPYNNSNQSVFRILLHHISTSNVKTRKRFSEKPVVAFTNSTVFTMSYYASICMTKPVWSHVLALSVLRNYT